MSQAPAPETVEHPVARLSVVVPTYERRDIVLLSLEALERQDTTDPYEVIVVVDGSTDGTGDAIRSRSWRMPLRVLEQENRGLAAARNEGARAASASVLLFLDDDMEAGPALVRAHLEAHDEGAEAVVGAMPLHPESPRNLLSAAVGQWADQLAARCAEPGRPLEPDDIFGGQLSIRRDLYFRLGGFDERFTVGGEFGNEDVDLAHRLVNGHHRVVFRPDAVSYQRYVITAAEHLRRWPEVGKADMTLARLHEELHPSLRAAALRRAPKSPLARAVVMAPAVVEMLVVPLRWLGVRLADAGVRDPLTRRLFARLHDLHYWLGVARQGGPHDGDRVRVLCWHAISDLSADPQLRAYGVPPAVFDEQLSTLREAGHALITADELLRFREGGIPVPRRSVLITFDDCYADLATHGAPILEGHDAPAAAFVVTQRVGDRNRWDDHLGVTSLPLADWTALKALQEQGVEIGSHSRTHPMLTRAGPDELREELQGSSEDLLAHGLSTPRLLAYPHGESDSRVRSAARQAGYLAAFTVTPGVATRSTDAHDLPRVEIMPDDRGWRLRLKVRTAGRPTLLWLPAGQRRQRIIGMAKTPLRILRNRIRSRLGRPAP